MMNILIVDDEEGIRNTIQEYLELNGCKVTQAESAERARELIAGESEFDLALLDITMPGEDGLSLARHLREHTDLAIIMLTAAGEVIDRIVGLEMGADDYIPKPVDFRELLARVKSVLGRNRISARTKAIKISETALIDLGICRLDMEGHKLIAENGDEIPMTAMEFDLLKAFVARPNRVLSRTQLLDLAHDRDWDPFDRSIDIRIARLRQKVEKDPRKPQILKTIRGVGYLFSPPKS